MDYLDVDTVEVQGFEWIKIGVDTGAGKTAWPQSITCGTTILGDSDLTFRTATGELVKSGERLYVEGCDDWRVNLRVRGVQAPVCKRLFSVGEYTTKAESLCCMVTKVTCSTKARMVRRKWMLGSRRSCEILNTEVAQLRTKKTTCTTST